jgi:hypothetical protein
MSKAKLEIIFILTQQTYRYVRHARHYHRYVCVNGKLTSYNIISQFSQVKLQNVFPGRHSDIRFQNSGYRLHLLKLS